jgi:uncharacterized membrane protein YsdA (DUF1294 family)
VKPEVRPPKRLRYPRNVPIAGTIYLLAVLGVTWICPPALWLFVANLCLSLVAFALYAADKSAAQNGRRRTPESQLHLVALLGGWPGAAVAQSLLRHKTQKREFQSVFKATAILNVLITASAVGYLVTQRHP